MFFMLLYVYWKMYCRGAVIDVSTRKVICLPPVKATEYDMEKDNLDSSHREIQYLIAIISTIIIGALSWILIERPSLRMKINQARKI